MTDSLQSAKSDKPDAKMVLAEMLDWLAQHGLSGPTDTGDLMQRGYKALAASQARVEALDIWMGTALARWNVVRNGDEMDVANFAISLMWNMAALAAAGQHG